MTQEQHDLRDSNPERKYFSIVPRLALALSRTPYDFTLWVTIRDVAGQHGVCYLSTRSLADLAMMSVGQVSKSRRYLLDVGLVEGELKRDERTGQQVWNLTIPDLTPANVRWAEAHLSIQDRLTFKKAVQQVNPSEGCSLDEHLRSLGEHLRSLHEQGRSPGETKKNNKKRQKQSEEEEATTTGPTPSAPADVVDLPELLQEHKSLQELKNEGLSNKVIQHGLRAHGPKYVAQVAEHALVDAADPAAWAAAALRAKEPYTFRDPDRELEAALGIDQGRRTAYLRWSSAAVASAGELVECPRCHKQVLPDRLEDDCDWH